MNLNHAIQHPSRVAWDGAASAAIDIRKFNDFDFSFEVVQDLTADAVFNVMSAPPSDADPCIAGVWEPVPEVLTCVAGFGIAVFPEPQATIVLPAGTPAGSLCTAAIPCRPNAFVSIMPGSGDTGKIRATAGLHGPRA